MVYISSLFILQLSISSLAVLFITKICIRKPVVCVTSLYYFIAAHEPMVVQVITEPYYGTLWFKAGPAQFGYNLKTNPPVSVVLNNNILLYRKKVKVFTNFLPCGKFHIYLSMVNISMYSSVLYDRRLVIICLMVSMIIDNSYICYSYSKT